MENMKLCRVHEEYTSELAAYKAEFLSAGSSMDGCGALRQSETVDAYLRLCREHEEPETTPPHLVSATQLVYIRESDGRLCGMLQIRHRLNDYLEKFGGHIGYSVRPSERRRGYAKAMLAAALPYCRALGLTQVLITCDEGNIASEKTIVSCGGVYENTRTQSDGTRVKRFWIHL